jgi:hypothetical protein
VKMISGVDALERKRRADLEELAGRMPDLLRALAVNVAVLLPLLLFDAQVLVVSLRDRAGEVVGRAEAREVVTPLGRRREDAQVRVREIAIGWLRGSTSAGDQSTWQETAELQRDLDKGAHVV